MNHSTSQRRDPRVLDKLADRARTTASLAEERSENRKMLLHRATFLSPRDQQLAKLAWEYGLSMRAIAELRGICNGQVSRQLNAIRKRLTTPLAAALLDDPGFSGCTLDDFDRELAIAHTVRNKSITEIAGEHGVTIDEVQRRLQFVRGWFDGRQDAIRQVRRHAAALNL